MHILVVDDDQAVRDSLKRSLEYSDYEVSTAEDGVQALARLAAVRPDAVIMDVMMPRLDGLETTRMLRAAGNDVPILVLNCWPGCGPWSGGPAPSRSPPIRRPTTCPSATWS